MNDKRIEAEAMYREALALGHPDPAFINNNRLAALISAVSAWEMEAKIRAYTGLAIEDGIVTEFLYRDSVKRVMTNDLYYRREGTPLHPMAVIHQRDIWSKYSGLKRLETHLDPLKRTYLMAKSELEAQRGAATGAERTRIEHQLMRLIAENESLFLIVKNQYMKRVEDALRRIARQHATDQGYHTVARLTPSSNPFGNKSMKDSIDITVSVLKDLEADPVTAEDLDLALKAAKHSIRLVEKNLKSEILLKS